MDNDKHKVSEFDVEVDDAEGKKQFHVTRVHVGTPIDEQERAGLILARAQRQVMHIRDQYLLLRGPDESGRDWLDRSLRGMIKLIDLADDWMRGPRTRWEDDNGNLVITRFEVDGTCTQDEDGIALGDYVDVLKRLYQWAENEAAFLAGSKKSPTPAIKFYLEEMSRLPADLDHGQMEHERNDYSMDISIRTGDVGIDEDQPAPEPEPVPEPEPAPRKWQVYFCVGADDAYYHAKVWLHGLTEDEAMTVSECINVMGPCGRIGFDSVTAMEDDDDGARPSEGWGRTTREDGTEVRTKGTSVHFYPQ